VNTNLRRNSLTPDPTLKETPSKIKHERNLSPILLTLIFAGMGSSLLGIYSVVACMNTVGFRSFFIVITNAGRQLRRLPQSIDNATFILYGLGARMGACSLFILPLAWVGIADRTMKLKKQTILTVNIWSTVFILILGCIQLPFYVLASQRFRENATFWTGILFKFWLAILASVICANLVALLLMNRMLQLRRRSQVTSGNHKSNMKMNNLIWRIQKAAGCFIILAAVLIGLMAYDLPLFERTYYSSPECYVDPYYLVLRFIVFLWILLLTTGLRFIAPILVCKVQSNIGNTGTGKASQMRRCLPAPMIGNSEMVKSEEFYRVPENI
jgi:UDP-N-acetylmuramyl pentapeptide phosphotransferase/UDP-N-acetylglucosamine-1-phosphate transferase